MNTESRSHPKREWNTAPTEPLPLRETLPAISKDTAQRLIAFALQQPAVMPWLLMRSAEYWGKIGVGDARHSNLDEYHYHLDATCALDLLEWQCGRRGKQAVEWLRSLDEVGEKVEGWKGEGLKGEGLKSELDKPTNPSTVPPFNSSTLQPLPPP